MKRKKIDKKKLIKWMALSIFLMAITILPSFEAIDLRYRKSVDLGENPVAYQLKAGDSIEQKLILDKDDRLDDLRIWLTSDATKENKGALQITLTQGDVVSESRIDTSQIVGGEYVATHLKLSRFTDGELFLTVKVAELDDDASVSTRCTTEAIYGLPQAVINGAPNNGTLSLNYKIRQPHDIEFCVSIWLVLVIAVVSVLASYVMTYTEETPKTGWLLIGLYVMIAMATYALRFPSATWEGESRYEGATFFYDNVANMRILNVLRQLEGGMYLSTLSHIIMIVAVRILRLRSNIFIFAQSMSALFWIMCLAPFCSHYFERYFTRTFRFVFPLIIICYGFVSGEYIGASYYGSFFLVLLLVYDFEKINNFIYAAILAVIPVICMSKMMFVVFAPAMVIYYLLFRKEMNVRKKFCVAVIGLSSLMEGLLSVLLRHGVQSGHRLGTIQHVALPTLVQKIVYYTVQTFGIQLRSGISNANQMLENVCVLILVIGIFAYAMWQIIRKGTYRREAKFIFVMFCLIVTQCLVILLTTVDWHADISWKQSFSGFSGIGGHFLNLFMAAGVIFLTLLWIAMQHFKPYYVYFQEHSKSLAEQTTLQIVALLVAAGTTFFYINQHAGSKSYESANPLRSTLADWRAYVPMLDSDAFCIRIEGRGWYYKKNADVKSVGVPRSTSADLSGVAELNEKTSIVFYVHKTAATNQILDRYYYMSIYDKSGNLISRIRQINSDAERLYIGFYPEGGGVSNIGRVDFTYEDGTPAFVDDTIEIGYR